MLDLRLHTKAKTWKEMYIKGSIAADERIRQAQNRKDRSVLAVLARSEVTLTSSFYFILNHVFYFLTLWDASGKEGSTITGADSSLW